jgi:hypothetical protein
VWELFLPGVGEGTRYKFEITSRHGHRFLKADPMARCAEVPPDTASIVHASHYEWDDAGWMAHRGDVPVHVAPFSVYEVHLPSWRPGLTFRQLAEELPAYVNDLGFTHVEFMPVAQHPFSGSWGYQITGFYAPAARLGTPDDFKYLVDALHRAGIGVIVDWVPAHFPKDDWALARFDGDPLYEPGNAQRAEHPDWGTFEFDFGRTEVRNFLVANAVYWCEEFHIDGLRVDAVASMLYLDYSRDSGQWTPNVFGGREDLDAKAFLQEMNATVYRRNPGVVTIAEESTAWEGVTRPTESGGLGFGLKWNMGWMHDSLEYIAKEPVHRKYHHHEMTFSMVYAYSENYVLPISHDEVVHGKQALVSKPTSPSCGPTRASNSSSWGRSSPRARSGPSATARSGGCSTRTTAPRPTTAAYGTWCATSTRGTARPRRCGSGTPTRPASAGCSATRPRTTSSRSCATTPRASPCSRSATSPPSSGTTTGWPYRTTPPSGTRPSTPTTSGTAAAMCGCSTGSSRRTGRSPSPCRLSRRCG